MSSETNASEDTPGGLFVFEGPDGVGKSTLAETVVNALSKKGIDTLLLSFPGREPKTLGKLVYAVHHNAASFGIDRISPISLQALHIAAHIDCIENRILPALASGKTVVLDRYWWSTAVYGALSGIELAVLGAMIELEKTVWRDTKPNKLFLVRRDNPYRIELSKHQWSRVCEAYQNLALEEKDSCPVEIIENAAALEEVTDGIMTHIQGAYPPTVRNRRGKQGDLIFFGGENHTTKKARHKHWLPTKTTDVFETYWRFAAERQSIFHKRLLGEKAPWTNDPILRDYKFTNAYRASDRVSQFLIRHVIYDGLQEADEIVFRILIFKTFNKIETWQLLTRELGQVSWREYDFRIYDRILTSAQEAKRSIYSAAYIMPSGANAFGYNVKHRNHLSLIQKMMKEDLPARICDSRSMQGVFYLLRGYQMIGDFLAYQYAVDINYSNLTNFSEMSFVVPGPGAKDGLRKCFSDFGGLSEVDLIKLMADRQEDEFSRLGLNFRSLWGRPLQLIDCQNLFCEVDKYARIAHPEIKGVSRRNRMKQKFKFKLEPIEYFYPPKWNINDAVNKTFAGK